MIEIMVAVAGGLLIAMLVMRSWSTVWRVTLGAGLIAVIGVVAFTVLVAIPRDQETFRQIEADRAQAKAATPCGAPDANGWAPACDPPPTRR